MGFRTDLWDDYGDVDFVNKKKSSLITATLYAIISVIFTL